MLQTVHNTEFSREMDLFKEIDDLSDLFPLEKNTKLSCSEEGYEDLQSKYSSLHENYAKEIENSKKVEKCLIKCLKFYSKLSKKYEVQQQIIRDLEESIKEKVSSLEEAQKNEEKLKGLIEVYRTERTLYAGQSSLQLRKEKEMLLDICCKLIDESVRSPSTDSLRSLLLRKFRKDLSDNNIFLLRSRKLTLKEELEGANEIGNGLKPEFGALKNEFKSEDKYRSDVTKVEIKDLAEDVKANQLDLGQCEITTPESGFLESENSQEGNDKLLFAETEQEPSLPPLEELPLSLEPICTDNEERHQSDVAVHSRLTGCDLRKGGRESPELWSNAGGEQSSEGDSSTENMDAQYSDKLGEPTVTSNNYNFLVRRESEPQEPSTKSSKGSTSIFDICDETPKNSEHIKEERTGVAADFLPEVSFVSEEKSEEARFVNNTNRINLDVAENDDDDSFFPYESEVFRIFREMASVRLLSPIRQTDHFPTEPGTRMVPPYEIKHSEVNAGLKRNSEVEDNCWKTKKIKSEDEKPECCLLDSIMSAMSVQNEEFRAKKFASKESGESGEISEGSSPEFASPRSKVYPRRAKKENCKSDGKPKVVPHVSGRIKDRQQAGMEILVRDELKNFVSSPISCKEDADRNVKQCISALTKKPEDLIAKCIVAIVLENIDEPVEAFERPAPPLTKTQHRLIILLSVFRTLDWDSQKISTHILSVISEKLFPDNFFWPDDCVEAAARFYAALCRARNDPKTLWKFCLDAMTEMRQRSPLLMFTVLQTWPDVLHDASTLKNNMLALTIVKIFLHMPQTEGHRNANQKRKLTALKHLLIKFYQFKTDKSIESHAENVLEGIRSGEAGSKKAIVLLSKCRDQKWTLENVVPALKSNLVAWFEGTLGDSVADTLLSVIKQICPILTQGNNAGGKMKELALCLCETLTSRKKSHDSEVSLIEVLLLLKQYPEVRKAICEWIPKTAISDKLRNEIINASAENILRELKLNRKKETTKSSPTRKKQWKKSKGKTKKGKKRKKSEEKAKA